MVVIAVPGGTGGVGRTIVEELLASGKYEVVILTRKIPQDAPSNLQGKFVAIDYSDIDKTAKTLEDLNVHTIISAINMDSEVTSRSQLQLIEAAEKSKATKRFIPSEWGIINTEDKLEADPNVKFWIDSAKALKNSSLQYTRIAIGFFMDYWGMPHVKSYLTPFVWALDIENRRAALPGDGEAPLTLTYSFDVAQFVLQLLETDDWPEYSVISGDDLTFNQMTKIAEEVRGSKFDVKYDSVEQLEKGVATMFESGQDVDEDSYAAREGERLAATFGRLNLSGAILMPQEGRINSRFPNVKAKTFKQFLNETWGGR